MQDLTLIFFILSIALFIARYPIKKLGIDFLCAVTSMCALVLQLQDETIPADSLLIFLLPIILIIMLTFVKLAYGAKTNF